MRTKRLPFTFAATDADGWLDGATGAGPWATFVAQPSDGCSHPLTILSSANLSTINFTLIGTDAEGRSISEVLAGPNNTTVTSVLYYKTLVSVTASATVGANTMDVGWTSLAYTPIYPSAVYPHDGPAMQVSIASGSIVYTKQQTNDQIFDYGTVYWHTLGVEHLEADSSDMAIIGASGVRISVESHTAAVVDVTMSQARA
jgi:hypothetical protein